MPATLTQVVKQFQQDWTGQLEPEAILTACRGVAYRWRERTLDPVTTSPFLGEIMARFPEELGLACGAEDAPDGPLDPSPEHAAIVNVRARARAAADNRPFLAGRDLPTIRILAPPTGGSAGRSTRCMRDRPAPWPGWRTATSPE